jgi:hypothetical protein
MYRREAPLVVLLMRKVNYLYLQNTKAFVCDTGDDIAPRAAAVYSCYARQ